MGEPQDGVRGEQFNDGRSAPVRLDVFSDYL